MEIFNPHDITSEQYSFMPPIIANQIRLGRLKVNTQFVATCLNGYLTEQAPQQRVLTGELIVF